jgi:hypothetical protein
MSTNDLDRLNNTAPHMHGKKLADVNLEQLCTAIEVWNYTNAGKKSNGTQTFDMRDIIEGAALFASPDTPWVVIESGPLTGHRYCKTQHGLVLQAPKPSNEMSLLAEATARTLGVKV